MEKELFAVMFENRAISVQEEVTGVKTQQQGPKTGKRVLRRALSWSVLSDNLPVQVHDSHAYNVGTNASNKTRKKMIERKHNSLEDMRKILHPNTNTETCRSNNFDASCTGKANSAKDELDSVKATGSQSLNLGIGSSKTSICLSKEKFHSSYNSATSESKHTGEISWKVDKNFDRYPALLSAGKGFEHSSNKDTESLRFETGRQWQSKRKIKQKYAVLPPIAEGKAESFVGTLDMYKKHRTESKRKKKLINDLQSQAKFRKVSKTKTVNFFAKRRESQKPRKLSPLRNKPHLPEIKEAIDVPYIREPLHDRRFQRLMQSLTKVDIN